MSPRLCGISLGALAIAPYPTNKEISPADRIQSYIAYMGWCDTARGMMMRAGCPEASATVVFLCCVFAHTCEVAGGERRTARHALTQYNKHLKNTFLCAMHRFSHLTTLGYCTGVYTSPRSTHTHTHTTWVPPWFLAVGCNCICIKNPPLAV